MKASEALLCVLFKLTFLSLGRWRVEFAVTMCCGKKMSLLNNPRLVCLHLFEILKGTHHAEHYVDRRTGHPFMQLLLCPFNSEPLFLFPNCYPRGVCVDKT